MKWVAGDIEMYTKAAEYVDTAVVPLMPVAFDSDMKQYATMAEFVSLLTSQLEKQFRGRIFLLPGYVYMKNKAANLAALLEWEAEIMDKHFRHVFYVTSDSSWKQYEKELAGELIWLPSLPLEHMHEQQKVALVEDQVKQLLALFTQKWRESE